ncbi:MAG: aldehyde dehydrogenase family protein, partial [Deltaproteobacteria bacterium]
MAFKNEPYTDFSKDKNKQAMRAALNRVRNELGKEYGLIIDGKRVSAPQTFFSLNPARKEQKIGIFHEADESLTEKAIDAAQSAFESWKSTPVARRIQCLDRMANLMEKKRFELTAWIILEIGKSWGEADGEVSEAIDFIRYYAEEMSRFLRSPRLVPLKNEKNEMRYIPLGVAAHLHPRPTDKILHGKAYKRSRRPLL